MRIKSKMKIKPFSTKQEKQSVRQSQTLMKVVAPKKGRPGRKWTPSRCRKLSRKAKSQTTQNMGKSMTTIIIINVTMMIATKMKNMNTMVEMVLYMTL